MESINRRIRFFAINRRYRFTATIQITGLTYEGASRTVEANGHSCELAFVSKFGTVSQDMNRQKPGRFAQSTDSGRAKEYTVRDTSKPERQKELSSMKANKLKGKNEVE